MKELIKQICSAKNQIQGTSVLFIHPDLYEAMKSKGLVIQWHEDHPCAIWHHSSICGMDVILDEKEDSYSVLPLEEARLRLNNNITNQLFSKDRL